MEDTNMSEPKEGGVVLITSLGSAITGFLTAAPIPVEWKAPAVTLSGGISVALGAWWYSKVNKQKVVT